jgi:hypothetical protein
LKLQRDRHHARSAANSREPRQPTEGWRSDGTGIIYPIRDGETDNLWLQRLDGSPGKKLTDFKSEFIRDFDYSYDGKQLAIIRGHRESDVVLIRDSEK